MEAHYEWKGPQQPGPLRLFLNFRKSWRDSEMNGSLQLRIIEMVRANSVLSRREAVPAPLRGAYLHPGWDPPRKLPSGELRTQTPTTPAVPPIPSPRRLPLLPTGVFKIGDNSCPRGWHGSYPQRGRRSSMCDCLSVETRP